MFSRTILSKNSMSQFHYGRFIYELMRIKTKPELSTDQSEKNKLTAKLTKACDLLNFGPFILFFTLIGDKLKFYSVKLICV